jgi:hypothetical protein
MGLKTKKKIANKMGLQKKNFLPSCCSATIGDKLTYAQTVKSDLFIF